MLLIATDEAGYGPKLGPLVIAATAWNVPGDVSSQQELDALFAPLRDPLQCNDTTVVVDDSKAVYQTSRADGLAALHTAVSASLNWCDKATSTLEDLLPVIVADDYESIRDTPWLCELAAQRFLSAEQTIGIVSAWSQTNLRQVDVVARGINAKRFNEACSGGRNKSDLLSESTLGLVRKLVDRNATEQEIAVYCDRHGGRRYYAGVLQHTFPNAVLEIIGETNRQSSYRLRCGATTMTIHFTVKGDSFTPVALSSLHAKYLRERFMGSLNRYFASRHGDATLKPTAGYPVDADRFLVDVSDILDSEGIAADDFVRSR